MFPLKKKRGSLEIRLKADAISPPLEPSRLLGFSFAVEGTRQKASLLLVW